MGGDESLDLSVATELEPARNLYEDTKSLSGLQEDQVWRDAAANLDIPAATPSRLILAYAFTEMLNNAIDHSKGSVVEIRLGTASGTVIVVIHDDGRGVFETLASGLGLPDEPTAIQELTKGKRTTSPANHTGEGIFFTSKAVDVFRLAANGYVWTVDNLRNDHAMGVSRVTRGTRVELELDEKTDRDLTALFAEFTEDYQFVRSRPIVKLFELGVSFVSRSEAKRLLAGMEQFAEIEVDFSGVESVGQGFVDELLRVWPRERPETKVVPIGMNPAVEFMVRRGIAPR